MSVRALVPKPRHRRKEKRHRNSKQHRRPKLLHVALGQMPSPSDPTPRGIEPYPTDLEPRMPKRRLTPEDLGEPLGDRPLTEHQARQDPSKGGHRATPGSKPISLGAHDRTSGARRSPDRRSVINRRAGEERGSPARVRVRFAVGCAETSALGLPRSQPITTSVPPLSDRHAVAHPPRRLAGFQGGYRFCGPKVFSDGASFYLAVLLHQASAPPRRPECIANETQVLNGSLYKEVPPPKELDQASRDEDHWMDGRGPARGHRRPPRHGPASPNRRPTVP